MSYQPSQKILEKYADVLVNYGLNKGKGIKKGECVYLQVPEVAKPLLVELYKKVLQAGAFPIVQLIPDDMGRLVFEYGNSSHLDWIPMHAFKGKIKQADHFLSVLAETDKHELEGIDSKKIMRRGKSFKPLMDLRRKKERDGKLSWTMGMYATEAMADEVGLTLKQYWNQIIKACYLREKDPVKKWREIQREITRVKNKLDKLDIQKVHIKSKRTDLWIALGSDRKWLGGTGQNIPSFELFISPDWRGTQGHIQFTEPLYRYGNLVENAYLEFKDGVVVKATATKGEQVLKDMIKVENADKVGEFSLTDRRLSKITKFMGETLYDENVGGRYGNSHIALGMSYTDSYPGDQSKVTKAQWKKMGYNDSVVHTDIVTTENRTVTAYLKNGKTKVIYKDGEFTV